MIKKYFYNINGIRFVLASLVLVHHVAVVTQLNGISNLYNKIVMLRAFGPVSVSLFFALSGFLISYILFIEKKETGKIAIKSFYFSRALRILPLYYIIVVIHLFIIPHTALHSIESKLLIGDIGININNNTIIPNAIINLFYLLLMPQIALALLVANGASYIPAGHVWSIGVEEIFYFIWPVLLLKYSDKFRKLISRLSLFYYSIAILTIIGVIIIKYTEFNGDLFQRSINFMAILFMYNRVSCMFIGAAGAYIFINKPILLQKIATKNKFIISCIVVSIFFIIGIRVPILMHELYCIFFIVIILFLIKNEKKYFLESIILNYLGKISYGIYMYQMIAIFIITYFYIHFHFHFIWIYILSFFLTIFLAMLSYEIIEKRFLKLKTKI